MWTEKGGLPRYLPLLLYPPGSEGPVGGAAPILHRSDLVTWDGPTATQEKGRGVVGAPGALAGGPLLHNLSFLMRPACFLDH